MPKKSITLHRNSTASDGSFRKTNIGNVGTVAHRSIISKRGGGSGAKYNISFLPENYGSPDIQFPQTTPTVAPPTLSLLGESYLTIGMNEVYVDAGASAVDYLGNDLTDSIVVTSNVDTSIIGEYIVTYTVTDASNNLSQEIARMVKVKMIYDYAVLGAGPSGLMTAYTLAESDPSSSILILEKGTKTLEDYKNAGYDNIFNWFEAQNDPNLKDSYNTSDNINVWNGIGNGGGTSIFGLQYIDNEELHQTFHPEWLSFPQLDGENVRSSVDNIMNARAYSYDDPNSKVSKNTAYVDLKEKIESIGGLDFNNNKVYSKDLSTNQRLLVGDLLTSLPNVTIKYDKAISSISNISDSSDRNDVTIELFDGTDYTAKACIVCSGSIQSSAILQRSGIDCGHTLTDHAGITLVYGKLEPQTIQTTVPYSGDYMVTLSPENLQLMYVHSSRYVFSVSGGSIPLEDQNKVYDFTSWAQQHPGGSANIIKWTDNSNNLIFPHDLEKWTQYKDTFPYLGKLGDTISYDSLTSEIKTDDLYDVLFPSITEESLTYVPSQDLGFQPSEIISHVQSRDPDGTHQTYFSNLENLKGNIILTHALSTESPSVGKVLANSDVNEDPEVTLNLLGEAEIDAETNQYVDYLYQAYLKNDQVMKELGYTLFSPQVSTVTKGYIKENASTIYHYQCSNRDAVDDRNKVIGLHNVYVGDISTLKTPYVGSTSFAALMCGYVTAKMIKKHEEPSS